MALHEHDRHRLHLRLDEVLGPEEASALMARLPESERDELVTKAYLDERLDLFRAEMNARFAELEASLTRQMHSLFRISLGAHATTLLAVLAILATR